MTPSHSSPPSPSHVHDPADTMIPFGKHKGLTLGDVAILDDGLRYLDWLIGQDGFGVTRYRDLARDVAQVLGHNAHRLDSLLEDD